MKKIIGKIFLFQRPDGQLGIAWVVFDKQNFNSA
jgi:hypothetical protein